MRGEIMEIVQVVGLALTATIFLLLLRQQKPVMAVLLGIGFGVFIFWKMLEPLKSVIDTLQQLTEKAGVHTYFIGNILKILGIAYLAEFASVLCADAGEQAIAKKVEFAAKILITVLALPIMTSILEMLLHLLPA